ncbi:MAG: hypothetical protein COB20_04385 [SAR86 cluster bacterium]|uniref:DUF2288 domain-containing protein n=1 Tax=SAR86 cluster bacterium TaxID=2030880 RepID=A0A2A4XAS2_9GAMM|nr:MAG: hypothetical protein COB20_04385 [SAR86 cluster bacterium]
MNEASEKDPAVVRQKLNHDTAKIKWGALHEHQQIECVIAVSADLDLIDVACEFTFDNSDQVKAWLEQAQITKVTGDQAQQWKAEDRELWAVVVAPWVLVQEQKPGAT